MRGTSFTVSVPVKRSNLVLPTQATLGYGFHPNGIAQLTDDQTASISQEFEGTRQQLEWFHLITRERRLLDQFLMLSNNVSYLDQTLARARDEASFCNMLTGLLHSEHTHSQWYNIPQLGIFIDTFTSTPIPENVAAIEQGQASVGILEGLIAGQSDFYEKIRKGVLIPAIEGHTINASGLEITVLSDGQPVIPQMVTVDSSVVEVGGKRYYNGLPHDRGKFPTALLKEGSQLGLKIKNTSDDVYLAIPLVNGMPMLCDQIVLYYRGFATQSLPIVSVLPANVYLGSGDEHSFDRFSVNTVRFSRDEKDRGYCIFDVNNDMPSLTYLAYHLRRLFETTLGEHDRYILSGIEDPHLKEAVLFESAMRFTRTLIEYLSNPEKDQAHATDIVLRKPVLAERSDELQNPMLGTIGVAVIKATRPPVKDIHTHQYVGSNPLFYAPTRSIGMGAAGAAQVGGTLDRLEQKVPRDWHHNDWIHKVVGYVPINLMSAAEKL
ncbi:MAG: hypothetical protein V1735_06165 [Nanoarchaeota archaeon]